MKQSFFDVKQKVENIDMDILTTKVRVFLKNTGQFEGYNMICARAVHEYAIPRL
mgnify:FL=1